MPSKRTDQIKAARSLNDLAEIVSDIAYEFKNSHAIVKRIIGSLSSTSAAPKKVAPKVAPKPAAAPARRAQKDEDEDNMVLDSRADLTSETPDTGGVKDSGYVAPKASDLMTHVSTISRMYDEVRDLNSIEALVKQSYEGSKGKPPLLDKIRALKNEVNNTLGDAFEALADVSEKHVPKRLTHFVDKLTEHLIKTVKAMVKVADKDRSAYSKLDHQSYVVPDPDSKNVMHFCEYISFENFRDESGAVYDQYFFVVTGVITEDGVMKFFLNSFPDFKRPGRYPLGAEVKTVEAASKRVNMLLAHNNFATHQRKQPLPFGEDRAKAMMGRIPGVVNTVVKDDDMVVSYNPKLSAADKMKMATAIRARLFAVVGLPKPTGRVYLTPTGNTRRNKAGDPEKVYGKADNSKVFVCEDDVGNSTLSFSLVPNADKSELHFSLQQMEEAAHALGLKDKQKTAFRFALQS